MNRQADDNRGLFDALIADGRPFLKLTGLALIGSGLFAFFLAATGHFLPHDVAYLGLTADDLYSIADGRVVNFMMHDRVSFGGAILAVGTLYLWLAEFPLRARQPWAWWTFLVSGSIGFASFLAYLGYGYLDSWHGAATLVLLPIFAVGMFKSLGTLHSVPSPRAMLRPGAPIEVGSAFGWGRLMLLFTAGGLVLGGATIMTVGMTTVFVPQDLEYMCIGAADLEAANARLIPLIAHDRAGFGGGVCCCGVTMFLCIYCGRPSRSLWETLAISGIAGFGTAIGVHFPIGYVSLSHLAPAYFGAVVYVAGMLLTFNRMALHPAATGDAPQLVDDAPGKAKNHSSSHPRP
jgi:hypothetical protein